MKELKEHKREHIETGKSRKNLQGSRVYAKELAEVEKNKMSYVEMETTSKHKRYKSCKEKWKRGMQSNCTCGSCGK